MSTLGKFKENKILTDRGTWLEIDVSTKTHPNAIMKVDKCDWKKFRENYAGRASAFTAGRGRGLYATCRVGKRIRYVHRLICETVMSDVDHINHNGLDNRGKNLRGCTHSENRANSILYNANTSGVTGVCWHKPAGKWRAVIGKQGKQIHLGLFADINDAIAARKVAEQIHFGGFAYAGVMA